MKLRYLLILALPALVACSSKDDTCDTCNEQGAQVPLSVMSFNIRYSNTGTDLGDLSWEARKAPCVAMIKEQNPDLIGFQEPRADQLAYLTEELPAYGHLEIDVNEGVGATRAYNILMYRADRFTVVENGHYWMSATPDVVSKGWDGDQRRGTVWAKLKEKSSGKLLWFFVTHLDHIGTAARLNGSTLNVTKMKETAGRYNTVFIVGDMNCSNATGDERYPYIYPYYEWMWSARDNAPDSDGKISYNEFDASLQKPRWNLDHIFYRVATPLKYRVIDSPDYGVTYLSDHWPIRLDCTF